MSPSTDGPGEVALYEVTERIVTITLNRPEARNALNSALLSQLTVQLRRAEADDGIDVIILTGTDPAFCAGLDLRELGTSQDKSSNRGGIADSGADGSLNSDGIRGPFPKITKPLIGAINGAAVTGGLELALNCDFLIASERARFGDTHARVGVMPGWGLTVLLPQAIGVRRAREMSFTGNFLSSADALKFGLVNEVVAHADLLGATRRLAADIVANDQSGVRQIRRTYGAITRDEKAWQIESDDSLAWRKTEFDSETVAMRRGDIIARGRTQQ